MKVRVQQNYDKANNTIVFGLSIKTNESRFYCKYPIGYQSYETEKLAKIYAKELQETLDNGGTIEYSPKGSLGKNKSEYVKIHSNK